MNKAFSSGNPSMARGVALQANVIGALIMREIHIKFGRENIGFLWILVEPIMFMAGVLAIRYIVHEGSHLPGGVDIVTIMFTGYPPIVLWRNCVNRNVNVIRNNQSLMAYRQVQPVDLVIAKCLLETASVILAFSICYVALVEMGLIHLPRQLPMFLLGWAFHIWYSIASGLLIAAISEFSDIADRVIHVMMYLSLPLCGMMYMVSWLPQSVQYYALCLPSVNAYEILRQGYFGDGVRTIWDMGYLVVLLMTMTFIGLALMKLAKRMMA